MHEQVFDNWRYQPEIVLSELACSLNLPLASAVQDSTEVFDIFRAAYKGYYGHCDTPECLKRIASDVDEYLHDHGLPFYLMREWQDANKMQRVG